MIPSHMMMMPNTVVASSGQPLQHFQPQPPHIPQHVLQQQLHHQQQHALYQQQQLQQQQAQQLQHQQQHQQDNVDPILKVKQLESRLKETLQKLVVQAAQAFNQNVLLDSCVKNSDTAAPRFDKCLEEFYAICDQVELNLRLAIDVLTLNNEAQRFVPLAVQLSANHPGQQQGQQQSDGFTYASYVSTVRAQLTCAQELHDALIECSRKINERTNAIT